MKRSESDIRGPWWHVAQGLDAPANAALVGACHSQLLFPGCLVKALSSWFFLGFWRVQEVTLEVREKAKISNNTLQAVECRCKNF